MVWVKQRLDIVQFLAEKIEWTARNECGVCYMGECMCHKTQPAKNKPIPVGKDLHGTSYKGISYSNPIAQEAIVRDTNAFLAEMREIVVKGHKGKEE